MAKIGNIIHIYVDQLNKQNIIKYNFSAEKFSTKLILYIFDSQIHNSIYAACM